jgi:hypothetical protein
MTTIGVWGDSPILQFLNSPMETGPNSPHIPCSGIDRDHCSYEEAEFSEGYKKERYIFNQEKPDFS